MSAAEPAAIPDSPRPSWLRRSVPVLAIFGLTFLAYLPALTGGLLWDDAAHLTAPALRTWAGLGRIWFQLGATQQYYPVLHSAFWLEHRLWGDALLGYHIVNVLLHATAACLFAGALRRIRPVATTTASRAGWEWLAAAIFALHPVGVESVAWISEQKNTLSLVYYLTAALAYLRFAHSRKPVWYATASLFFLLALLSKSVTATLPAALLLVQFWRRGRVSWQRDVVPLLPWFILGATAGLFTAWVEKTYIGAQGAAYDLNLLQRCFLAGRIVWFYLGKLVWPAPLVFVYPRWQVTNGIAWAAGSLALALLLAGLWWGRRRAPGPLVALLFFVGSLFPALGFFNVYPFIFSYVADHWQYLPALGIMALTAEGVGVLAGRIRRHLTGRRRAVALGGLTGLAGAVLAVLFALTWRQCRIYREVETLYAATLAANPDCWMAHNNLGEQLLNRGALPEAITHFRQAIALRPEYADAHNNLGNALLKTSDRNLLEAIIEYQTALRIAPGMVQALVNLGWALCQIPDRTADAIDLFKTALQKDPDCAEAHFCLGYALAKDPANLAAAIAEYETAVRLKPGYADARNNLGNALLDAGRAPEAIVQLEAAVQLQPRDPKAYFNLGTALARSGHAADALRPFEQALQLQPDDPQAHNNLGNVLAQLGRREEALAHYQAALQLNPDNAGTHFNLARASREAGDRSAATAHYQAALRLAGRSAEIHNSFGTALLSWERPEDAAAEFAEAVRLQPDSAAFRNNLGIALTSADRLAEAINCFQAALRLAPGYADAHYNLGVALQKAGHDSEAAAEFAASGRGKP